MERGILVVSFGTTYQETREKNIDHMVALVREQYPHDLVEEAYSSSTVRKVLRERDGIAKDDVRQALCRMRDAGVRRVIVFPTHIIDGIENHRMKQEVTDCAPWFEDVRIADALLKTPEDYQRTAEALWKSVAAEAGSSPVIFMGHGSEHAADESYERLECVLAQVTENDVYVATVEGSVTIDDVIGRMKVSRHKSGRVLVAPFMMVAGDHANHDMAGEKDSFAAALREAGYEPVCLLKGIGAGERVLFQASAALYRNPLRDRCGSRRSGTGDRKGAPLYGGERSYRASGGGSGGMPCVSDCKEGVPRD